MASEPARVLVLFETGWDRRQLARCRDTWEGRVEVVFPEPSDADCAADYDVLALIDRAASGELGRIDGVFSASDYPGAMVASRTSRHAPCSEQPISIAQGSGSLRVAHEIGASGPWNRRTTRSSVISSGAWFKR